MVWITGGYLLIGWIIFCFIAAFAIAGGFALVWGIGALYHTLKGRHYEPDPHSS